MLSRDDKDKAARLRARYIGSYNLWSHNPSDFNHTVACLREMRDVAVEWLSEMAPYMQRASAKMNRGGCFSMFSAAHEAKKGQKHLLSMNKTIFDKSVSNAMKEAFAKDARFISMFININDKTTNGVTTHAETVTITFSDHSQLVINSLQDEAELERCREKFDAKLHQLSGLRLNLAMN